MSEFLKVLITIKSSLISKHGNCVIIPKNRQKCFKILRLLYQEGFILSYVYNKSNNSITIYHNYYQNKPAISIMKIFNKASFGTYVKYLDLINMHKFGVDLLIISTSKGLKPHYKCIQENLGGQLLCYIR